MTRDQPPRERPDDPPDAGNDEGGVMEYKWFAPSNATLTAAAQDGWRFVHAGSGELPLILMRRDADTVLVPLDTLWRALMLAEQHDPLLVDQIRRCYNRRHE